MSIKNRKDITGQKFNMLTAVCFSYKKGYKFYYLFKCDCGVEKNIEIGNVIYKYSKTKSCGCYNKKKTTERNTKHNMKNYKEYDIWSSMKQRCYNKENKVYKHYGGRGIKICDRWLNSFENFYNDMGKRPTNKHTIERINNNGNYEPNNCKWVTMQKQCLNRRSNVRIKYKGETKCLSEWCKELGFNEETIRTRIKRNKWSVYRSFNTPLIKGSRSKSEKNTDYYYYLYSRNYNRVCVSG